MIVTTYTLVIKYLHACRFQRSKKSKVERWTASRQVGLYPYSNKRPSQCGLSWLRARAPFGYGKETGQIFIANGSSTPQKWDKVGQSNFKSCPNPKYIYTYKARVENWGI